MADYEAFDRMASKAGKPMVKYITVDTRSFHGLERAEQLKAEGWEIGSVGLYTIQFYKK